MVNVRTENDVDRLRQMAILLQVENEKLHKELQALAQRVETLSGTPTQAVLAEVIGNIGDPKGEGSRRKSERRGRARRPKDEKIERTTHGTSPQEGLHVDEDLAELSEADCKCGDCGLPLNPMVGAFEPAEYIDIVERKFVIRRTKRQKYKKTCDCPSPIVTAPYQVPPDTLGGR
jgi:transposase